MDKDNKNDRFFSEFDFVSAKNDGNISKSEKKYEMKIISITKLIHHSKNNMLLPQLTNSELKRLKERIKEYGFTENIEVTKANKDGFYTVLDGNHRVKILREYKSELNIDKVPAKVIDIPEELEADYIVSKNYDRRQLSKLMQSYIRGKQYNAVKKQHGGRRSSPQNDDLKNPQTTKNASPQNDDLKNPQTTKNASPQNDDLKKTSEILADKYGLARSTIERDGRFSKMCDELIMLTSYEFVFNLLNGEIKANKSVIKNFHKLPNPIIEKVYIYYRDSKDLELKPMKQVIEEVKTTNNVELKSKKNQWKKKSIKINSEYEKLISNLAKQKNIEEDELINEALKMYIENNK